YLYTRNTEIPEYAINPFNVDVNSIPLNLVEELIDLQNDIEAQFIFKQKGYMISFAINCGFQCVCLSILVMKVKWKQIRKDFHKRTVRVNKLLSTIEINEQVNHFDDIKMKIKLQYCIQRYSSLRITVPKRRTPKTWRMIYILNICMVISPCSAYKILVVLNNYE
ncbi:hypothetical protein A3Q56_03733, partial [Intoshia linei]